MTALQFRRGIAPELLLSQIKNTVPYLFEEDCPQALLDFPASPLVRTYGKMGGDQQLSHVDYFKLCLCAHYLTCATPVPTDVDRQIRQTLWPAALPLAEALKMAEFVLESRKWDFTAVSARSAYGASGPWQKEFLNGHLGEWFTVASGAYGALAQYPGAEALPMRSALIENIRDEVQRHSEIFASLWKAGDGLGCLKASACIAHNFGDLDRVIDMWSDSGVLPIADPLRLEFYKLATTPFDSNRKLRHKGRLWVAGELYKSIIDGSSMALENHRHFALRKPRCLRKAKDFLIPLGPFFDAWGRAVAEGLSSNSTGDLQEVIAALVSGQDRLSKTVGYTRALLGILEVRPDASLREDLNRDPRARLTQDRFEKKWNEEALKLMDDIPSRA